MNAMNHATSHTPSFGEMADRLELFEINLLQETVDKLTLALLRAETTEAQRQAESDAQAMQINRLLSQAHARDCVIEAALAEKQELAEQLKKLRELDPERTRKLAARQKKEKAEITRANTALAKSNSDLKARNQRLAIKCSQLDRALEKAIKDFNESNAVPPVLTVELVRTGRWAIYTCERNGHYDILDITNNVSQTVRVIDGAVAVPKLRPIPKDLHKSILQTHEHFHGAADNA